MEKQYFLYFLSIAILCIIKEIKFFKRKRKYYHLIVIIIDVSCIPIFFSCI